MPGDKRHGRRDRRLPTTGRTERRAATAIRLAIKTVRATRRRPHDDPPPAWFRGDADAVLAASRERGLEGVVGKPLASRYRPGRRSAWIKVKNVRHQEVIICGWHPGQGRRADTIGSLLLGVYDHGQLRYAGNVGTGFTDAMLAGLMRQLAALRRDTSPFATPVPPRYARGARWVQPRLVGDVAFTEWTADGSMRHPGWRGLRAGKNPEDVPREGWAPRHG